MNLRNLHPTTNDLTVLPKWLKFYAKDTFNMFNEKVFVLEIESKCIFELTIFKMPDNNNYLSWLAYSNNNATTIYNFNNLNDNKSFCLIDNIKNDGSLLNSIDEFISRCVQHNDITFTSSKPSYKVVKYLLDRYCKG